MSTLTKDGTSLTEDEAKRKFCPIILGHNCRASDCMMWRWRRPDMVTANEHMKGTCGMVVVGRNG
jgi:hypothetical protein